MVSASPEGNFPIRNFFCLHLPKRFMARVNGKQPMSPRSLTNHVNSRALGNREGSRDEQNSSAQ